MTAKKTLSITPKTNLKKTLITTVLISIVALLIGFSIFQLLFRDRYFPNIYLSNVHIGGLTKQQAKQKVLDQLAQRTNNSLTLYAQKEDQTYNIELASIIPNNLDSLLNQNLAYGRQKFSFSKINPSLNFSFDQSIDEQINQLSQNFDQPAIDAQLKIEQGNQITVTPSQKGSGIDIVALKQLITNYLNNPQNSKQPLPIKQLEPQLRYQTALNIKKSLDQIKVEPIKLVFKDQSWTIDQETALTFIDLQNTKPSLITGEIFSKQFTITDIRISQSEYTDANFILNEAAIEDYLNIIAQQIDQPVQEPLFQVDPQSPADKPKIQEFRPPQLGQKLQIKQNINLITQNLLTRNSNSINLAVEIIQPKNKLVNELGIKELIGRGVSHFAGSIENRIYNIRHAANKINGLILAPGETFSFVNTVGDISAATGFKQAYVIKSGRTVLDDGGGVCQVSTTVFRAALYAGLAIPKRTAHAYRVTYYEQGFPPGLDATIFHPSVDLQFRNDTAHHILVQSYVVGTSMYVDLYGTSDGRTSEISKPIISSQTPPPPELRQDDPTLPKGTIKQVDWSAWGANVTFTRKVTRGGETLVNETYRSNYRPWQAVYLVGTKDN